MTRLVDVADFASGGTPSKTRSEYWNGTIPWLTPKDTADWEGKTTDYVTTQAIGNGTRIVPAGSVFIAVRGMSLHTEIRVIFSNDALAFNQDIKALLPKKETDGRFVYYALSAHKEALLALVESAGHGTGRLPTDQLEAIEIPDFSCEEQRQIVELLGALDDKIDLNRRTNETLEAMARALFRDWFVDFGPIRAKMAGQTPYLAPEIWELFPDRLDDEGKPEGWKIGELQELTTNICNGGTPKRTESTYWKNGNVPWLTSGEVRKQYVLETENYITDEGLRNSSAKWISSGSIVIALYGATAGEVGLTAIKMTTNQAISALMPRDGCKSYIFYIYCVQNSIYQTRPQGQLSRI
ncbi:restriction endonuclease subunit S [Gluconobacter kanchanaburiensis]|uniref:Type I restriction modification DNA specificity domain-containing protein n=1 Tax=Gluconobacter kanchanaburiensis NBRC 103587 TaxID=1307948 RepID=A0A511BAK1_9PROT|nr:restriction endonuclease subunit S [Gluconobacter kanchanaburiensis]MBF0863019.1 hypothetical protein [Gluconobacter kanchanaburiensis]GBR69046.1 restriction endonuclease S subunit [Gluconobacter kanchanaburiensis NBRC 103587]GEK97354.1 hypothetical protein GKA01_25510 [Gluconobacter kanchanaburiensis NBRC 103587]